MNMPEDSARSPQIPKKIYVPELKKELRLGQEVDYEPHQMLDPVGKPRVDEKGNPMMCKSKRALAGFSVAYGSKGFEYLVRLVCMSAYKIPSGQENQCFNNSVYHVPIKR